MRILVLGERDRIEELQLKFDFDTLPGSNELDPSSLYSYDVIFDLNGDEKPSSLDGYSLLENKLLVVCSVKKSLAAMMREVQNNFNNKLAGINALPTFISRNKFEVSFLNEESRGAFSEFAAEVKTDFLEVKDGTGMVTPRVIFMIINEACYSLHEGVATRDDIDKAMKLGTNYPYGPFEWCDRIGIENVYETLEAIWNETQDKRYEICPLLKEKYLSRETFYT